jgi:hypothetical protein
MRRLRALGARDCVGRIVPIYHFHVRGGPLSVDDEEGVTLPDDEAARREALRGARSILAAEVLEGRLPLAERIEVVDGEGRAVLTLGFDAAFTRED